MHEYVQKLTSTTLPRRALLLNGAELSQATAPSRSGIRPSSPVPEATATNPTMRAVPLIQRARFFITETPICCDSQISGCVPGEDEVARFGLIVAGEAGFHKRLLAGFAVFEVSESPAARRGVFLRVLDHKLNVCGGAGDERLGLAKDLVVFLRRHVTVVQGCNDCA